MPFISTYISLVPEEKRGSLLHQLHCSPLNSPDLLRILSTGNRNRELGLMLNFCQLLQMQAVYDLAYLATNIAGFIAPVFVAEDSRDALVHTQPFVMPLLHIFLTGEFGPRVMWICQARIM